MITFDTNCVIYYLENDPTVVPVVEEVLAGQFRPFIATVTELELFSFPFLSPVETARIEEFLATCTVVLLDSQIARIGARLRREYRLKTQDSAIAATALFTHSTLLTRNTRDFKKISGPCGAEDIKKQSPGVRALCVFSKELASLCRGAVRTG